MEGIQLFHHRPQLRASAVFVKICGALYKIPLNNILGDEGVTHFMSAYNIYAFLLTLRPCRSCRSTDWQGCWTRRRQNRPAVPGERPIPGGDEGVTHFMSAYNIYAFLLTLSTAGLPLALSKLISEADATGRRTQMRRCFNTAMAVFVAVGAAGTPPRR